MINLIRLDARVVGAVEYTDHGIGLIEWFHNNKPSCSMDHAMKHEGYSVDVAADIDCNDVEGIMSAICDRATVTMDSNFIPFSKSRHAKSSSFSVDGKPWESLNWEVEFSRYGKPAFWSAYSQGVGHAPASKKSKEQLEAAAKVMGRPVSIAKRLMIDHEIETGFYARGIWSLGVASGKRIEPPSIGDVMQSLIMDSNVLDHGNFASWANEYDYNLDSHEARETYSECLSIALNLRSMLGQYLMDELRLVAQYN